MAPWLLVAIVWSTCSTRDLLLCIASRQTKATTGGVQCLRERSLYMKKMQTYNHIDPTGPFGVCWGRDVGGGGIASFISLGDLQ